MIERTIKRVELTKYVGAVLSAAVIAACGHHSSPIQPSPGSGTSPCTPAANTPPVILSMTAQGLRTNEPADFADVGESIPMTAIVQDAETPVDQLHLQWTATVGTLSGSGTSVTWQAPSKGSVATPADVTITLTVVENYGCTGQPPTATNTVSATHTISLHDSAKEVGDMATQFLDDFSNSNITDVSYIMRNFEPGCYGTAEESGQVATNRADLRIVRWSVGPASLVSEPFGNSLCGVPGRTQRGDACVRNDVHWESTVIVGSHTGDLQVADGVDWIAAYYRSTLKAWRLCDSQFTGTCSDVTAGIACDADFFRAMVAGRIK